MKRLASLLFFLGVLSSLEAEERLSYSSAPRVALSFTFGSNYATNESMLSGVVKPNIRFYETDKFGERQIGIQDFTFGGRYFDHLSLFFKNDRIYTLLANWKNDHVSLFDLDSQLRRKYGDPTEEKKMEVSVFEAWYFFREENESHFEDLSISLFSNSEGTQLLYKDSYQELLASEESSL